MLAIQLDMYKPGIEKVMSSTPTTAINATQTTGNLIILTFLGITSFGIKIFPVFTQLSSNQPNCFCCCLICLQRGKFVGRLAKKNPGNGQRRFRYRIEVISTLTNKRRSDKYQVSRIEVDLKSHNQFSAC